MKFTLSWLKEHLDTAEPLEKLVETLTMIGLEVEHIDDKAKALAPFTIARVISAEQHPNADRLRVCMVDTGDGSAPVQVVCGAPNARAGLVSVFSPPGTFIPGKNITLSVGTIRASRWPRPARRASACRDIKGDGSAGLCSRAGLRARIVRDCERDERLGGSQML